MYRLLEEKTEDAIKNAKIALKKMENPDIPYHEKNPATTVHELVECLMSYLTPIKARKVRKLL